MCTATHVGPVFKSHIVALFGNRTNAKNGGDFLGPFQQLHSSGFTGNRYYLTATDLKCWHELIWWNIFFYPHTQARLLVTRSQMYFTNIHIIIYLCISFRVWLEEFFISTGCKWEVPLEALAHGCRVIYSKIVHVPIYSVVAVLLARLVLFPSNHNEYY